MSKKILIYTATILLVIVIWQLELIIYGIRQGVGQLKVIRESVPIQEVMENPDFPDSLKTKIKFIQDVRQFAIKDLGLEKTDNYSTFFDQKGQTILWNLSACQPFKLEPKTWWFPIVGSVPYKGFFDLDQAKKEEEKLMKDGFDTRTRPVSGWSTLGWLKDPILSNMLERSEGRLAELIIHELTHSTIFVKSEIEFNENLASFIGVQGAIDFLKKEYGDSSAQLTNYQQGERDSKKYTQFLLRGTGVLNELYENLDTSLDLNEKLKRKNAAIRKITESIDTVSFYNNRYYQLFDNALPNNSYFMTFMRYHSSEDSLQSLYHKVGGSLSAFIKTQKEAHAR